jgi:serine/threonine protein kinase
MDSTEHTAGGAAGRIAGRFRLDQVVGRGAAGIVYRAIDEVEGTTVAVKILAEAGVDEDERIRLLREGRILGDLRADGIVGVVAFGSLEEPFVDPHGRTLDIDTPWVAMEWLDGEDLWQRLHRQHLTLSESVLLLNRIADALACAHRRGIVHRDLKPSNLFLRDKLIDRVTLLDFGVARGQKISAGLTQTGALVGTPGYMAPEQARGRAELRPSADIFALGCVVYECLTGRPPFVGEHLEAILVKILFEEAPPLLSLRPELPVALEQLINRMLRKEPGERIPDAMALLEELRGLDISTERGPGPHVAQHSAPEWLTDSEQKLVTVIYAREGDPQTQELTLRPEHVEALGQRLERLREELTRLGLRTEMVGDGALIGAFTIDGETSALDQAERAARCALLIHDGWSEATVSVATGRGVITGQLPMGEAIGRAIAHIHTHLAQPEVLGKKKPPVILDEATAGLCETRFRVVAQSEGVVALLGPRQGAELSRPLLGRSTPCVGREPDLSMLDAALNACIEEVTPRALLVVAPPGAGKSRLRHEFLRRLTTRGEDVLVLTSRGDLMGSGTPFAMLRQALLRACGVQPTDLLPARRDKLRRRIGEVVSGPEAGRTVGFLGELCGVLFPHE